MKKQIIIGVSLLVFSTLKAQYTKQYVHFDIGGGLNNLEYNLQNGTEKGQLGYSVNGAYSYFFKRHWGLKIGVGVQSYGAHSTLNFLSSTSDVDTDGDSYEFRTNYKSWEEKQHALFVEVPLEVQYRHFFSKKIGLLASAGAKVSIPVLATYETTGGTMVTSGYYSQWNVELNNMPQHGFTTLTNTYSGDLSLKAAYTGIADVGCLFTLSKKMNLYLGGYVNYGLNNILKPDTKQIYQSNGTYNGVLTSDQLTKITPVALGIKVGLCWQLKELIPIRVKQPENVQRSNDSNPSKRVNKQTSATEKRSSNPIVNQGASNQANDQSSAKSAMERKSSNPVVNQEALNQENNQKSPKSNDKNRTTLAANQNSAKPINERSSSTPKANQNQSKSVTESVPAEVKVLQKKTLKGITFEAGKSNISKESNIVLNQIVSVLNANPTYLVEIQGYADSEGNIQVNKKLSELRANEVRNYLIGHGIDKNRVIAIGYGDTMPVASNETAEGRSANRRVEFVVSYEEVSLNK